ncbi:YkvI family membrane protein [Litchfieldia alkalitelluris]|uniref:YkvI family membrane protein n=1 Tax=Litchfieldia alkalitelluris TaxID=304268 RepID=UPI0009976BE4|nr:GerAB/ArcD/ProY family transporter [Litchfieldia alkalitelluris]
MWSSGFKWMFLIMGTTIGAGYASGRELWQFFGDQSGLAIILFTVIFSICCFVIMKISYNVKSEHFIPVLQQLIGKRLAHIYDVLIILYLFTTTIVMLAGGGATLEAFQVPFWVGIFLFCALLVLLFVWGIKGMVTMNIFILPVLITGLIITLLLFISSSNNNLSFDWQAQNNWPSAFTFTALNILPLIAVLSAVGKEMKHIGEARIASVGSGLILGGISFIYNESLMQVAEEIMLYEIPLFAILKYYPYPMLVFMSFLLWSAIFTTAASGIFGITTRFREKLNLPLWVLAIISLVLMIPFTTFGFATLVSVLYPIYGIANLYLLTSILLYPIMNRYKFS